MTDHDHLATRYDEELVFFPYGDLSLAGVLTLAPEPNGRTVLLPWGSSTVSSAGVNRVRARIARALAADGYHSFRFDYPGIGESQGHYVRPEMSSPFTDEVLAACEWLAGAGHDRIVVVGQLLRVLVGAAGRPGDPRARGHVPGQPAGPARPQAGAGRRGGVAVVGQGLRKVTVKKLLDPARRAKYRKMVTAKGAAVIGSGGQGRPRFPEAVRRSSTRGVPLFVLFGDDDFRDDFEAALERGLQARLRRRRSTTRVKLIPERLDGIIKVEHQDMLIRLVVSWLDELPAPPVGAEGGTGEEGQCRLRSRRRSGSSSGRASGRRSPPS